MKRLQFFAAAFVALCCMLLASESVQAQSFLCNTGTCSWKVDYTTNMRLSTGPAILTPGNCYMPVMAAGEFVRFIWIDGIRYATPAACIGIPPNSTCNSFAHTLCPSFSGWTIN